jgi:hypothetical protein
MFIIRIGGSLSSFNAMYEFNLSGPPVNSLPDKFSMLYFILKSMAYFFANQNSAPIPNPKPILDVDDILKVPVGTLETPWKNVSPLNEVKAGQPLHMAL